jgi:hypothetical protein
MNVTPELESEFNEWYDTEHLPRLRALPGVISARRFKSPGAGHRYVATYHLTSADVGISPAWQAINDTPWARKILPQVRDRLRLVLKRYVRTRTLPA